jgi:hypothetical protein
MAAACGGGAGAVTLPTEGSGDVRAPSAAPGTASFSPTSADFPNPERGFYGWSGSDFINGFDARGVGAAYSAGQRLVLARVPLDGYRGSDLPDALLVGLDARFATLRAAGMKATLWFSYDFSASGNDASAAQIKRHLEQLRPVLSANADVIPYMRAGFIGAWGEWHSSKSGNSCGYNSGSTTCSTADANRAVVRDALLANVPATTQIGFRYPADLMKWYPSATQQSRAGMHNDCFLSGSTDSGTYQNPPQRTYAQELSLHTAFGGETCTGETPLRTNCTAILREGAQHHLAWLNSSYSPAMLEAWKAGGCYPEVSRSMGYRLQLDGVTHDPQVARGGTVMVAVDLRNVGWARVFSTRKLLVTLRHRLSGQQISAEAGPLRVLMPQAKSTTRLSVPVAIPLEAQAGDYDLYLSAPDVFAATAGDARFALRFANADDTRLGQVWDPTTARFRVGTTLTVQ